MPQQPQSVLNEQAIRRNPFFGTPGGFLNLVIPCLSVTDGDTIELTSLGLVQFSNKYYDQGAFGFIADAAPTSGPLFVNVNGLGDKPIYHGISPAQDSAVSEGDYCQIVYDSELAAAGGFYLLNWTKVADGSFSLTTVGNSGPATFADGVLNIPVYSNTSGGATQIETTAGPFVAAADDGAIVLNKAVASPTSISLGPVAARSGLPITISDAAPNGGNAGDITITPDGAETIMGGASFIIGSGGSATFYPSVDLNGWFKGN